MPTTKSIVIANLSCTASPNDKGNQTRGTPFSEGYVVAQYRTESGSDRVINSTASIAVCPEVNGWIRSLPLAVLYWSSTKHHHRRVQLFVQRSTLISRTALSTPSLPR